MQLIDCSVDHGWGTPDELLSYLPSTWRDYVGARELTLATAYPPPVAAEPSRAFHDSRAPGVASLGELEEEWLDPHDVDLALLTYGTARATAANLNPHMAAAMVRAANDWTIERWLDSDGRDRVRGAMLVPEQVPEDGAAEIRRVGSHPKMAAVLIGGNGTGKPMGHPIWDPIHRAAADQDLPLVVYAGADALQETATYPTAGGPPSTFAETQALAAQALMTHLLSLIAQGTFERYPGLRVVFAGGGFTWLPSIIWRCDVNFRAMRVEVPWLKVRPSEYLVPNVRIVAAPLDCPRDAERVGRMVSAFPAFERLLCFGSGFPGRRHVAPAEIADRFGPGLSPTILAANAKDALRVG
jgi:predicted TIM-barrel fold metal-dependent hydrolase